MTTNSERNEAFEILLQAVQLDAEAHGGDILAAARAILEEAQAAKAERDLTPYDRGYRDAAEFRGYRRGDVSGPDAEAAYAEGYGDGSQQREDERCDQIEADYLDGLCTLSGNYHLPH